MTAIMRLLSTLLIGGNTGLLHLAVAMGKRVIMLMDSLGPGSCPPLGRPEWALVPEHGTNLSSITSNRVLSAFVKALAELGNGGTLPVTPA